MAKLPPTGNPGRPLYLAARSSRLLGILYWIIAGLYVVVLFYVTRVRPSTILFIFMIGVIAGFALSGFLFLLVARKLKQLRRWAVTLGLIIASILMLLSLLVFAGTLRSGPMTAIIPGLWLAAMVQLILHLSKSYAAIEYLRGEGIAMDRGFAVLPVATSPQEAI